MSAAVRSPLLRLKASAPETRYATAAEAQAAADKREAAYAAAVAAFQKQIDAQNAASPGCAGQVI